MSDRDIAAWDPDFLVFWSDSIAVSQLAVWLPVLRRSRYRFLVASGIDREPRTWDRPSDHAPAWVSLHG